MLRLILACLLSGSLSGFVYAHDTRTDSLMSELDRTNDPKKKVDVLNELAHREFSNDPSRAYDFADKAFVLAEKNKYAAGTRRSLTLRGYYFFRRGDHDQALQLYKRSAAVSATPDKFLGYNYVLTGNLYRSLARYDTAERFYLDGLRLLRDNDAKELTAFGHQSLGELYLIQWRNAEAAAQFREAEKIYSKTNSRAGRAEILLALADLNKNLGDYQKAERYIKEGCALAEEIDDQLLNTRCRIARGEILYKLGEFLSALDLYLDLLEENNDRDDPHTHLKIYSGIGDVYEVLGQNDLALRYFLEALEISEFLGMEHETGKVCSNIAWIYKNQKNFTPAFEFVDKSQRVREEIGDAFGVSNSYNVRGVIYLQQKNYLEAVRWITRALEVRKEIGYGEGVAACYYNLGMIYEEQKKYREALAYQLKAYEYEKQTGNKFNIGTAFSSIGSVYTYLGKYDSARYYLEKADEIGRQTGSLELQMENCFYWSEFYEYQGKFTDALAWHKKYAALNDSVYHETGATRLAEMQALYQADQKDKAINVLSQEKELQTNQLELQKAQIRFQRYLIISAIVALVLVSLLAYKTWKYNREIKLAHKEIVERKEELQAQSEELQQAYEMIARSNRELERKVSERTSALTEAYRELDTFFYRASHDFRRPLTTFLGLAEVAKITLKDANARELFDKVRETAVNLDKMLLKLQSISDLGSQQLVYGEVNMCDMFQRVVDQFRVPLEERHIHTATSCIMPERFFSYPEMVYLVLENLVENAIAFCRYKGAQLQLRASTENGRMLIEVEDNGDGIEEQYHSRIFDMYFRGNDRSKGNGLGLYIIRKAVEKLDGTISFTSTPDQGTHFILNFPLDLKAVTRLEEELAERMHL